MPPTLQRTGLGTRGVVFKRAFFQTCSFDEIFLENVNFKQASLET